MRFLLKVNIPVDAGNAAAKAGKLGATIQSILADLKPEAVYFTDDNGQRTAFILKNHQGLSIKEIAAMMDTAEGTVKVHLHRAVMSLRQRLAEFA